MDLDLSHHGRGDHGLKLLLFTGDVEGEKQSRALRFHPNICSISIPFIFLCIVFFFIYSIIDVYIISPYYLIVRVVGDDKPSKSPIPRYGCQLCWKNPQPQGVPFPQLLISFLNSQLQVNPQLQCCPHQQSFFGIPTSFPRPVPQLQMVHPVLVVTGSSPLCHGQDTTYYAEVMSLPENFRPRP